MKKRNLICGGITILVALVLFYMFLPPINITSMGFWTYILTLLIVYTFLTGMFCFDVKGRLIEMGKSTKITFVSVFIILGLIIVINVVLSPMFMSKEYASRITINEDADFTNDVAQVNFNQLPLLDKD